MKPTWPCLAALLLGAAALLPLASSEATTPRRSPSAESSVAKASMRTHYPTSLQGAAQPPAPGNPRLAAHLGPAVRHPEITVDYWTYVTTCPWSAECAELAASLTRASANLALERSRLAEARRRLEAAEFDRADLLEIIEARGGTFTPAEIEGARLGLERIEAQIEQQGQAWDEAQLWVQMLENRLDNLVAELDDSEARCPAPPAEPTPPELPLDNYFDDDPFDGDPHRGPETYGGGAFYRTFVTTCPLSPECQNLAEHLSDVARELALASQMKYDAEGNIPWLQRSIDGLEAALLNDELRGFSRERLERSLSTARRLQQEARQELETAANDIARLEQETRELLLALNDCEAACTRHAELLAGPPLFSPEVVDLFILDDDGFFIAPPESEPSPPILLPVDPLQPPPVAPRGSVDLRVEKSDLADPVNAGEELVYRIVVMNNGDRPSLENRLTDAFPGELDGVSASPGCTVTDTVVQCDVPPLDPGASVDFEVRGWITGLISRETTLLNRAWVEDDPSETNDLDNEAVEPTVVLPRPPPAPCPGNLRVGMFTGNRACGIGDVRLLCPGVGQVRIEGEGTIFLCDADGHCGNDNVILGAPHHTVRFFPGSGNEFRLEALNNDTSGRCVERFVGAGDGR